MHFRQQGHNVDMADMARCVSDVPEHFVFASFLAKCTVSTGRQFFVSPVKFLKLHPSTLCKNLPRTFWEIEVAKKYPVDFEATASAPSSRTQKQAPT